MEHRLTLFLLGSREFSGRINIKTGETEIPDLKTHYTLMNAQEECVSRPLPISVVVYHLYLKLVQSGMTMDETLSLGDEAFGMFLGQGFQINCSAALFQYEKDFVPGLCLSLFEGLTLAAVPTEDMVVF